MATTDPWETASGTRKQGERKKSLRLAGVQPDAVHTLIKLHNWRSRAIYVYHLVEREMKRIDKPTEEQWTNFSSIGVSIPYPSKDAPATEIEGWIDYGKEQASQLGLEVRIPDRTIASEGNPMNIETVLRISDRVSHGSANDRFEASVLSLRDSVAHATFLDGLDKHWKRHETRENSVMPQSWCWLVCWAMTGGPLGNARLESRKAFESIFDSSDIDSYGVGGESHTCWRSLRYAWDRPTKDVEQELLKSLGME